MTRKQIEWFCIIGNILAIAVGVFTQNFYAYLYVAGVPNGVMLGMLFVEHREKDKNGQDKNHQK